MTADKTETGDPRGRRQRAHPRREAQTRARTSTRSACRPAAHIAGLIKAGYKLVITHGNGPQVGFILRRSELSRHELHEVPLDSCGADSQGAIGYQIQQAMYNQMRDWPAPPPVATVVTQTVVDRSDPSFQNPSKPIGSFMNEADATAHRDKDGWVVVEDAGRGIPSRGSVPAAQADRRARDHPAARGERRGGRGRRRRRHPRGRGGRRLDHRDARPSSTRTSPPASSPGSSRPTSSSSARRSRRSA